MSLHTLALARARFARLRSVFVLSSAQVVGLTARNQLNREITHENIVALKEVILEDKSIYMVFEYAEHDFLVRPRVCNGESTAY